MRLENKRIARGLAIIENESAIERIDDVTYKVKSQFGEGWYTVTKQQNLWGCTCPDFIKRNLYCKHIYAVEFSRKMRELVQNEVEREPIDTSFKPVCCPECGSHHIKKDGVRKTKRGIIQRFKCNDCQYRFIIDKGFNGMKNTPQCILASVDLFFKGLSYRKIADHLEQFYGVKIAQTTPMRWVQKYLKMLGGFADKHQPKAGKMWHIDEMTVKAEKKHLWIWNVMDHETRFLLACKVSKGRTLKETRKPIKEARERAGKKPDFVITDGLPTYPRAISKEFGLTHKRESGRHHRYKDFRTAPNNNILERLNGTVRERLKVMRGLQNLPTAQELMDGFQVYYNYIRPHSSIGMTPAMASDIDLNLGDNRWMSIVEMIANQKQFGESKEIDGD